MKETVTVKGITIGKGVPKICVPIVGKTITDIINEAELIKTLEFDVVEWRVDYYEDVTDKCKVKGTLQKIRQTIPDKPIIFTFRSAKEGGEKEVSKEYYFELNREIIITRMVDIIDIELFNEEKAVKQIIDAAHRNSIAVIISNHDFSSTPDKEEIITRLRRAQELGGDIPKIAVMPNSNQDVITLLDATREAKEKYIEGPIITMSMSGKGVISRLSGEIFGSALTFGAAKQVSAPGQIPAEELRKVIQLIHDNL